MRSLRMCRVKREDVLVKKKHEEYRHLRRAWEGDLNWELACVSYNLLVLGLYVSAGILLFVSFVKRYWCEIDSWTYYFSLIDADE